MVTIKGKLPEGKERIELLKKIDEYFSNIKENEEKIIITKQKNKKITLEENKNTTKIKYEEKTIFKNTKIEFEIKKEETKKFKEFLKQHNYKKYKEDSYYKITYKNEDENSIIDEHTILTLKLNTIIGDIFEITTKKETKEEQKKEHLKQITELLGLKNYIKTNIEEEYKKKLKEQKEKEF